MCNNKNGVEYVHHSAHGEDPHGNLLHRNFYVHTKLKRAHARDRPNPSTLLREQTWRRPRWGSRQTWRRPQGGAPTRSQRHGTRRRWGSRACENARTGTSESRTCTWTRSDTACRQPASPTFRKANASDPGCGCGCDGVAASTTAGNPAGWAAAPPAQRWR